jgi:glutamate-1-semialdehyde 2,1-aminomutase
MLRDETRKAGALLIFDEVMTSRLHYRALHGAHGINPDFLTLGKYLGGGASFGAFGGRADLIDRFDPASPGAFSHGGTFNNNLLSMAGGLAGFTEVLTEASVTEINERGDRMRERMNRLLGEQEIAAVVLGRGSLMNLHFVTGPVETPAQLDHGDTRLLSLWQVEMLLRGYHVTPRGMMALSLPFSEEELDGFLAAFEEFLSANAQILPHHTGA